MSEHEWSAVDRYIVEKWVPDDDIMAAVSAANQAGDLPSIDVSPAQGKFLYLLAKMMGAKRVLEIGTLGGYSTIWLARALAHDGIVVTLEVDSHHAEVARGNIERAGLGKIVDLRVGAALQSLPAIQQDGLGPFDLVFIDADKRNNPHYLDWAIKLARPGTVIIVDNVIREGAVIDAHSTDANVLGIRDFFDMVAQHPRLDATAVQTVGSKGWDGFAMIRVDG